MNWKLTNQYNNETHLYIMQSWCYVFRPLTLKCRICYVVKCWFISHLVFIYWCHTLPPQYLIYITLQTFYIQRNLKLIRNPQLNKQLNHQATIVSIKLLASVANSYKKMKKIPKFSFFFISTQQNGVIFVRVFFP